MAASIRLSGPEYLGQRAFGLTMLAALAIHLAAIYGWHLMPKVKVVDVPVRTLNIKLGGGDAITADAAPAEPFLPTGDSVARTVRDNTVETQARAKALTEAMSKMLEAESKPAPTKQAAGNALDRLMGVERAKPKAKEPPRKAGKPQDKGPIDVRSEGQNIPAPTLPISSASLDAPVKNVRQNDGSLLGNSTDGTASTKLTYDQTVKLWIEKFKTKVTVPTGAPDVPQTVVRIRIDRRGNIFNPTIEQSSGYETLDREALNMIRRANPVPPAPGEYSPGEDSFEFKIPIVFK